LRWDRRFDAPCQGGEAIDPSLRKERLFDLGWLLAFGLASSLACLMAAHRLGATFDEPIYLEKGLEAWHTGSHHGLIHLGTMPLPADVQSLPLYLAERWRGQAWDVQRDFRLLLPWFRLGTLVFWWMLLVYAQRCGRYLVGRWGGRLAVALIACEPNLLAHAGLATADLAITACLLALTFHFRTSRDCSWFSRVGLPMLWFALALLTKASGLMFGPLCLLIVEVERLARLPRGQRPGWAPAIRSLVCDGAQIALGGLAIAIVYCGSDFRAEPTFVAWAHRLPEGGWKPAMVWFAEHLRIFSNAGEGLVRQIKHNLHGHGTYLLGATSATAFWYYFPVLLTIKLPTALLLLTAGLIVLRPRGLANWAALIAAVMVLFSFTCRVQIGIRLVLPLVALACVGVAAALASTVHELAPGWPRRLLAATGGLTVAWMAIACVLGWPHGLCYVNEIWGGAEDGYRLVGDSNYDWGQGLPELAAWHQAHPDKPLEVWYFGTDPSVEQLDLHLVKLHDMPIERPEDVPHFLHERLAAVSMSLVHGYSLGETQRKAAEFFRQRQPIDRTTTFLIYDLGRQADDAPSE
jgi:hypothetical protein